VQTQNPTQQTNTTTPNVPKKGYTHKTIPRRIVRARRAYARRCAWKTFRAEITNYLLQKNSASDHPKQPQFILPKVLCNLRPVKSIQSRTPLSLCHTDSGNIAHMQSLQKAKLGWEEIGHLISETLWGPIFNSIQRSKKKFTLEMSKRRSAMIALCVRRVFPQKKTHTHKTNTKKSICDYGFCDGTKAFLNAKTIFKRSTQLRSGWFCQ
jgi:hypothetical protein